jgi:hypothetical protein
LAQPLLSSPCSFRPRPRVRASVAVLAVTAALFGGWGCLYTDPVNKPPDVQINMPSQMWRNQVFNFRSKRGQGVGGMDAHDLSERAPRRGRDL